VGNVPDATRARSFGAVADEYAAHRPGYPDAAIDWALGPAPGRRVLDLAAGTGKLTACLVGRADVVAVEPDPGMLGRLRADLPEIDAREGTAEEIPLPDASVDAVLVGQAIHWFDEERAYPEIARVLRPGGVFAGLWNADDGRVDWVRGIHDALHPDKEWSMPQGGDEPEFDPGPLFGTPEERRVDHTVPTTAAGLEATIRTHSWALTAPAAVREAAFARMRDYLATRPETSSGSFALPLFTIVLRTLRR
jgi:SAM-dependent methyltransferase